VRAWEYRERGAVAGTMVTEDSLQRLRDADATWRAELNRLHDLESVASSRRVKTQGDGWEWRDIAVERSALRVAIKALDLCIARRVVPRLATNEVVIPPKQCALEHSELSRHSHGPVVVECELGCLTTHAALDLIDEAHRASEYARGWAPLYVLLWVELLRNECEHPPAPQPKHAARLVVVPEQDGESNDGQ